MKKLVRRVLLIILARISSHDCFPVESVSQLIQVLCEEFGYFVVEALFDGKTSVSPLRWSMLG